jgi:hypothetical protein
MASHLDWPTNAQAYERIPAPRLELRNWKSRLKGRLALGAALAVAVVLTWPARRPVDYVVGKGRLMPVFRGVFAPGTARSYSCPSKAGDTPRATLDQAQER